MRRRSLPIIAILLALPIVSSALEPVPAGLPALPAGQPIPNPYRGNVSVHAAGESAYERHCATCHGEGARRAVAEGPDLRRLNTFCNRLVNPALKAHCLGDVDTYFLQSVREGKLRAGLMHMPAWKDVLPLETIWAIRSFTESQPLPPARRLPDLPPVTR